MNKYSWVACSVLLVSIAQIFLRLAMLSVDENTSLLTLIHDYTRMSLLAVGLGCYLVSLLCWTFALRRLPLGLAYPLLSTSYIIVWLTAICFPGWEESFSWQGLAGIVLIITGIIFLLRHKI